MPADASSLGSSPPDRSDATETPPAVVLAAGKGVRMRSQLPKVLHHLAGKPLLAHVLGALSAADVSDVTIVTGHGAERVEEAFASAGRRFARQVRHDGGTGDALLAARHVLGERARDLLVVNGDCPLLTAATLRSLYERHTRSGAVVTLLTARPADPAGLGRVRHDTAGAVIAVVERAEAEDQDAAVAEINAGAYCFRQDWLWSRLEQLAPSVLTREIYLTGLVAIAARERAAIATLETQDASEALGVDDRVKLAEAEAILRRRACERWMRDGVTIVDPASTSIDDDVILKNDVVLLPQTTLRGHTTIAAGCEIGPATTIVDSTIGPNCRIVSSTVEVATVAARVEIGPYSHLRPGARIEEGVHIGNYTEIKNSRLGAGTQMGHFSYIGDADVGANVNVGAGTITCNFDGLRKHRTVIEDDVLLGSGTLLVAPVRVGRGAATGAGSVVTHDVAPGDLVVGIPGRRLKTNPITPERRRAARKERLQEQ